MKQGTNFKLQALRHIAGEGRYAIYSQLRAGRRFFVVAKLTLIIFKYWKGKSNKITSPHIAIIKGSNQFRHYKYSATMISKRIGEFEPLFDSKNVKNLNLLPRLKTYEFLVLLLYVANLLLFPKTRHLSLFMLRFNQAIERIVKENLKHLNLFLCFNDQPFDVASFVYNLHYYTSCKTITVQHGLILSPKFYFPTNTKEFWAWGELSKSEFSSRNNAGNFILTGRYSDDAQKFSPHYINIMREKQLKALCAFSFKHEEILSGIDYFKEIRDLFKSKHNIDLQGFIKLHPAIKLKHRVMFAIKKKKPDIIFVEDEIESASDTFDVLITLNSSSCVDFILKGKLVFFTGRSVANSLLNITDLDANHFDLVNNAFSVKSYENSRRLCLLKTMLNIDGK